MTVRPGRGASRDRRAAGTVGGVFPFPNDRPPMPAPRFTAALALLAAPCLFVGCAENDDFDDDDAVVTTPAGDADVHMGDDHDHDDDLMDGDAVMEGDAVGDDDMDTGMDGGVDETRPSNELDG